ncbi:MAG: prephenate dehydratase [Pseudomonadota bacterium]
MSDERKLEEIRERIDALDQQILSAVSERAKCAQEVAEIKLGATPQNDVLFYRPEREAQVLRKVMDLNKGPLDDQTVAVLFREVMSACLALEQPLKVAYLGPEGTFTHSAVLKHFGHAAQAIPLGGIDDVFRSVENGSSRFGVVPVENSTEGVINHTLDLFLNSPLRISGEVVVRIHHNLVGNVASLDKINTVLSHQQSLAQCRNWLTRNLPNVELEAVSSNAEAARLAAEKSDVAAIAPQAAAEIYNLDTLASKIEDKTDNTTRFLIIGNQDVPASGDDKTSILFAAPNKPGSLYNLLKPLAEYNIDMNRLESRPSKGGLWEYVFFVDINGHHLDDDIKPALDALSNNAPLYRVLGSYPRAAY